MLWRVVNMLQHVCMLFRSSSAPVLQGSVKSPRLPRDGKVYMELCTELSAALKVSKQAHRGYAARGWNFCLAIGAQALAKIRGQDMACIH